VRFAIDLDDNLGMEAGEVGDPGSDRNLAAEPVVELSAVDSTPEGGFGDRRSFAVVFGRLGGAVQVLGP
jgi:hypothetical protein